MQRQTQQRSVLRDVLSDAQRPLTREELLELGRQHLPSLGKATVDRFIREQRKAGKLVGLDYPGQPIRYQRTSGSDQQYFICRQCDRMLEVSVKEPRFDYQLPPGYRLTGYETIFYGVCPDCQD